MFSCQSSIAISTTLALERSDDLAWAHGCIVSRIRNSTQCVSCSKINKSGGIPKLKYHLTKILRKVEVCKRIPYDIKWQMKELINDLKKIKKKKRKINLEIEARSSYCDINDDNVAHCLGLKGKENDKKCGVGKSMRTFFTLRITFKSQPSIRSVVCSK